MKPNRPYPDFPLFPHGNGQWAKKIRGKLRYFGKWNDWRAALEVYELEREALYAGRDPSGPDDGRLSVADGCNLFLVAKRSQLQAGELAQRTFGDYVATCKRIVDQFGRNRSVESLTAADFDELRSTLSDRFGPVRLTNEVRWVRGVFRYLHDASLIDVPVRFGPNFKPPSAKTLRLQRAKSGKRLFTSDELAAVLKVAPQPMRTIILLGINSGLGNTDVGQLEWRHLDMDGRWLNFPRPKTGIDRRARLWPETVEGLRTVRVARLEREDDRYPERVFLTKYGHPWHQGLQDNPITHEMAKLLKLADVRRPGLNFYALRHTFQTIGEECGDLTAVRVVMGHAAHSRDMSAVYREAVSDERLARVAGQVRQWLFSNATQTTLPMWQRVSQ